MNYDIEKLRLFFDNLSSLENYNFFNDLKIKCSMLHADVLAILSILSKNVNQRILEIGPYIGGSTIALCTNDNIKKIITIEKGGIQNHKDFSTTNIIKTLKINLIRHQVLHKVKIIEGASYDDGMIKKIEDELNGEKIELLFIDADGDAIRDINDFKHLLSDDAFLVVDDYLTSCLIKKETTKNGIDCLEKENIIKCIGVYGHGTWVGHLSK